MVALLRGFKPAIIQYALSDSNTNAAGFDHRLLAIITYWPD